MNHTEKLKAALWQCYGHPDHPAEWDGTVYGGGKMSQRFWEYHQMIEMLELTPDSVVLDIGGGSPITGAGFFTRVIAPYVREVHVLDVNIGEAKAVSPNIKFHRVLGSYERLAGLFQESRQITHVACISVFEHIPDEVRCGMVKAVNEHFAGDVFAGTLEFHPLEIYFEHQLTTRTLSKLFAVFTNFYPDVIRESPFWCENSYAGVGGIKQVFGKTRPRKGKNLHIPLWYPIAFKFQRVHSEVRRS